MNLTWNIVIYHGFFAVFGMLIIGGLGASIFYKGMIEAGYFTGKPVKIVMPTR